jgi:transcriptional regulator with XRE-family HTH domain
MTTDKTAKPVDVTIGLNVRRIRILRGVSQKALGVALGITFQQVQKYEKGHNRISGSAMTGICQALNCSIMDLFAGTPVSRPDEEAIISRYSDSTQRLANVIERLTSSQKSALMKVALEYDEVNIEMNTLREAT